MRAVRSAFFSLSLLKLPLCRLCGQANAAGPRVPCEYSSVIAPGLRSARWVPALGSGHLGPKARGTQLAHHVLFDVDEECRVDDVLVWRGQRVSVVETGVGDPLLLLSGLGSHADMWEPFIAEFADRRIIRFDMPGTGRSSTPLYPISIAALAELAVAVLDHFDTPRADVVGFSYGGAVAQQTACDYPNRIRRLLLAATTCGVGGVPGSIPATTALATPLRFYSRLYFDQVAAALYGGATGRDPAARAQQIRSRSLAPPPSSYGYAMQMLGATGWSSLPFLADIPHETLVISGGEDPLVPVANAQILARRIPRARLEIVKDAGHLLLWDDAPNVAARIRPFINRRAGWNPTKGNAATPARYGRTVRRPDARQRPRVALASRPH
jgi:pimeloyl-ACP methyl ester carboxylesterase